MVCRTFDTHDKSYRLETSFEDDLNWHSNFSKKLVLSASRKIFKNNEKCFLFHVTGAFCSQDI